MSPSLKNFRRWATEHSVRTVLEPHTSSGKGNGLFIDPAFVHQLKSEFKCGSEHEGELLFVPHDLIISRSRVLKLPCLALKRTFAVLSTDLLTERLVILLFLLYQRLLLDHGVCVLEEPLPTFDNTTPTNAENFSAASLFEPYIAMLPDVCTPVTLDPDLVRGYLAGTLLLDSVCAKRSKLEAEFELLSGNLGVFDHWAIRPSLDNFIWADAIFWSRVLSFQTQWDSDKSTDDGLASKPDHQTDDLHMVPFLDFANHATYPNIRWQVDPDGLRVWAKESLLKDLDSVENDENRTKSKRREVFLSYGNKPNVELLFLYGFTLHDNPTKTITLAMPMDEDDPYYMPKAHTLMRLGIPPRITVYMDKHDGPCDLVEICKGLWITHESQCLLWLYALNEEDGIGALIEEPDDKICVTQEVEDDEEQMEEADLMDEGSVGRLMLTIQETKIVSKEELRKIIPKLDIYPVLILRSLVLLADRVEFYITRIMETGDKVQIADDLAIVRAINYEIDSQSESRPDTPSSVASPRLPATRRLCNHTGDCLMPTLLEPDQEHPITCRQFEAEMQISSLVSTMKSYRIEEMNQLVQMGNFLGEAQTSCLEESTFIRAYLSRMHSENQEEPQ
ncbi:hypothetical protein BX616_010861 [Lobosporangium transversale]|uniref:SET domain-containing protein n=1 Tax=Lobosporangium transversale TaxID=64571 RepID=A0A1Y2H2L1_9FUNG|nr:hypothetical protein BCR41DRAFT_344074 [Lobosporangium transversale]KAF9917915.1 hypothetical protein BX616_010861 [Lobosporangium transversale]ORZ28788.1 hypothetical protein BCR41DRAFT_344074 [Lobosporangium transversale]|eukprot:XP_021886461.1 hypothetical protein BCR41DRAFT_344074 [Lobosporangium transversale]